MADTEQEFSSFFRGWIVQQEEDLKQLIQGLNENADDNEKLVSLVEMCIKHYGDYCKARLAYAPSNVLSMFSPKWCTPLENAYMWVAGCKPSIYNGLIHTLCGSSIELHIDEFLQCVRKVNLGKVASMQEEMADEVLVQQASNYGEEPRCNGDVVGLLDSFELARVDILKEADELRLSTLKEMVRIMTPAQSVEFLIAAKKLHLTMHKCCHERDHPHQ